MPPVLSTVNAGAQGSEMETLRQQRQVNSNIVEVYPADTPFYTLLNEVTQVSDGRANKIEFQYHGEPIRIATLTAALAANGTTLTVDNTTNITESTILVNMFTREQALVLSKTATTVVVGTRGGFGGGVPQAGVIGDQWLIIGTAREEGDVRLAALGEQSALDFNWFQQFERVYGATDRVRQILFYGPNAGDQQSKYALNEYKKQMERAFLFGYRAMIPVGSSGAVTHPRFIMGGMIDFIEAYGANVFDAGGAFTFEELGLFMQETTREGGPGNKFGLASRNVIRIMSNWALPQNQMNVTTTDRYGINITRFFGPGWQLTMMNDDQFEVEANTKKMLMICDRRYLKHHIMNGLGDTVNENVTGPKKDGDHTRRDQLTGVHTLEVNVPGAHALITNITS